MTLTKNHQLEKKYPFDTDYIFIDGMSRSGKGAIAPIVSSLSNVEHFQSNYNLDRIVSLLENGDISDQGFEYLLHTDLIMDAWFQMIGRNLNTNHHDITSILNSKMSNTYRERESMQDTAASFIEITEKIETLRLKFCFITDDWVSHAGYIRQLVPTSKFIFSVRNPIDLVFAFLRSGRGHRFGKDKRLLHPTYTVNGFQNIPMFACKRAAQYHNASETEKACLSVLELLSPYLEKYNSLVKMKGVLFINFDKFVCEPDKTIEEICDLINVETTLYTQTMLQNARIPRELNHYKHRQVVNYIYSNISEALRDELNELCCRYSSLFPNNYSDNDCDFVFGEYDAEVLFESDKTKYLHGKRLT